jgi:hypothetical protein
MLMPIDLVFPAPAGMNRASLVMNHTFSRVPRTRGDEPHGLVTLAVLAWCSPHPRG